MIGLLTVVAVTVIMVGISSLATEERVLIFSWSVWTWPQRLVQVYRYTPRHRRIYDM